MNTNEVTRRKFILAAVVGSTTLGIGLGSSFMQAGDSWAQSERAESSKDLDALVLMTQQFYPHSSLSGEVYAEVVEDLLSISNDDTEMASMLDQAVESLDREAEGNFFKLDDMSKLTVMESLAQAPFFEYIRFQVLLRLYSHPTVWKAIGYPGSSVEHGGYVDRGFNDINWLTEKM